MGGPGVLLDARFRSSLRSKSFTKPGPAEQVWVDPMSTNTSAFTTMLRPKIISNLGLLRPCKWCYRPRSKPNPFFSKFKFPR